MTHYAIKEEIAMPQTQGLWYRITHSKPWRSFFRHGLEYTPLNRVLVMTTNFYGHIHPAKISRRALKTTTTFGLGLISFVIFAILAVTGVLLMFYYVPSTDMAYDNMVTILTKIPFGRLFRNMHRWGAHLMVIVVVLHMMRVFYSGAYKPPREFNWILGSMLLLLTLLASFTGYLLPWDQLAYWAITVGTSVAGYTPLIGKDIQLFLMGGAEVGQAALIRFYVLHLILIPMGIVLITTIHIWRVRKDGGLAGQTDGDNPLNLYE
jgi:quinol-cytochrome oxidoreductase complex cytochrome b subunit